MSKVSLREAKASDVVKHTRLALPDHYYGVVAVEDGKDIGAAFIIWGHGGRPFMCLEISEELRKNPAFMVRVGKALAEAAGKNCQSLYSMQSNDEPTSARLLSVIGFSPTSETINGERVWTWQKPSPH